jgi:hypothetical protein
MSQKPEVVFAPGCFDNFEGSQEELNEFIAEIQRLVNSGELFENAVELDLDNADIEDLDMLLNPIENNSTRTLQ